jgi:hypothetical protein
VDRQKTGAPKNRGKTAPSKKGKPREKIGANLPLFKRRTDQRANLPVGIKRGYHQSGSRVEPKIEK